MLNLILPTQSLKLLKILCKDKKFANCNLSFNVVKSKLRAQIFTPLLLSLQSLSKSYRFWTYIYIKSRITQPIVTYHTFSIRSSITYRPQLLPFLFFDKIQYTIFFLLFIPIDFQRIVFLILCIHQKGCCHNKKQEILLS